MSEKDSEIFISSTTTLSSIFQGYAFSHSHDPSYAKISPSITCGDYETETDSAKAFDEVAEKSGLFEIWREVTGKMNQPLHGEDIKKHYRIDRILVPTQKLRTAGWTKELIGVELKRSVEKVGKPLSQSQDYFRCEWNSPANDKVFLDYVFLWPLNKFGGPVASIAAQNHFGGCCIQYSSESEWHRLLFHFGEQNLIESYLNTGEVRVKNLNLGNKTGSR